MGWDVDNLVKVEVIDLVRETIAHSRELRGAGVVEEFADEWALLARMAGDAMLIYPQLGMYLGRLVQEHRAPGSAAELDAHNAKLFDVIDRLPWDDMREAGWFQEE